MTFEPQIPSWGNEYKNYLERLKSYHDWLCKTGINNGLISEKPLQYIWDEFIVHSLYFGKILQNIKNNDKKKIHISKEEAEKFYKVHESKPFYNDLCTYLSSGPIVVMILQRENAVTENFKLTPTGIIESLGLKKPIYRKTSYHGHFGRNDVSWELVDEAKKQIFAELSKK